MIYFPLTTHWPPHQRRFPNYHHLSGCSTSGKNLYQDKLLDSVKQKSPTAAEPDRMIEEEDKKISALGQLPGKLDQGTLAVQPNAPSSTSPTSYRDKMEINVRMVQS
ncbi:hypothetical protein ACP70R_017396 [Stipagrostis hirtigluma subsp. patula]